ncbi:MAG: hypothetical protein JRM80_03960 [Nitrososphaerota archaeon]|nr:hypothetical protein [Nitrososphaerota archaeon]
MNFGLTAALQELASFLQSAAMAVPMSQLTFASWLVIAICGLSRTHGAVQRH